MTHNLQFRQGLRPSLKAARCVCVMLALTSIVAPVCALAAKGDIVSFDPPGSTFTVPYGINESGTIVGYYQDAQFIYHGFVRDLSGSITTFDAPGAAIAPNAGTLAFGINDAGQIVGYYSPATAPGTSIGYIRDAIGTITSIQASNATYTQPSAINSAGQVAGCAARNLYCNDIGSHDEGIVRDISGNITVSFPQNSITVNPLSINSKGDVTGFYLDSKNSFHGFTRASTGKITEFDAPGAYSLGGSAGTRPWSINDNTAVAGFYQDATLRTRGFVRDPKGNITSFDAPGTLTQTTAVAINAGGAITGWYSDSTGATHGFFRDHLGTFTGFDAPGGQGETYGISLNRSGQIVGYYLDTKWVGHGFLRE